MVKHIAKIVLGEELYNIKDTEVRGDLNNHASNTDIHVTAAEKEYWNSKVNPPSYSAPTAKQLTYTGEAQDLLNPGSSTSGSIQYSTDEVNWSTTIPQATNAGTYTVYWKFAGSEIVYVDSTAITVTIAKASPTYTAPTGKSNLIYDGTEQELITAGSSSDGTFKYSLDGINWGYEYVDLGLPSGTKWAKVNVGANSETDYGNYYKYGSGTSTHDGSSTYYTGAEDPLSSSADTATQVMGGIWHTPTYTQLQELGNLSYIFRQWTTINGVAGMKFTSTKPPYNYIFLPASGYKYGSNPQDAGVIGSYWSSTPDTNKAWRANRISFSSSNFRTGVDDRYVGGSVRGVVEGTPSDIPSQTNAGTYTVYWKFEGDANHSDVAATSISVSIAKADRSASFEDANGNEYVDLGLPSGVKFAVGNIVPKDGGGYKVGEETDRGAYVTYGNTTPYFSSNGTSLDGEVSISEVAYKLTPGASITFASPNSAGYSPDSGYDAARELLGGSWRTPSANELIELCDNCTYISTTKNNIQGFEFTSNINGNKIFFPKVGYFSSEDNIVSLDTGVYMSSSWFPYYNHDMVSLLMVTNSYKSGRSWSYRWSAYVLRAILGKSYNSKLSIGDTDTIQVYTAGSPTITLSSSDTNIATVSGMTVTAIGTGTTTITATLDWGSNYNITTISYVLNVKNPNGVYAIYSDGSLKTLNNADTNALGVAVISDDCAFIVDKTARTKCAWDSEQFTNGVISGCTAVDNSSVARLDFAGVSNTNAIASVASGGEAAKYCRQYSMTIGGIIKQGYFGACGEVLLFMYNLSAINSMLQAIGGVPFDSNNYYNFWSSTQTNTVYLAWLVSGRCEVDKDAIKANDTGYAVVPFYSLD